MWEGDDGFRGWLAGEKAEMIHISRPFVAKPGEVFVVSGTTGQDWQLCPESEAEGGRVIVCTHCDKPAVQLDHFWPYYSEHNLCTFHAAPTGWAKTQWGKKWHWIEKGRYTCSPGLHYSGRVRPAEEGPEEKTICKKCHARTRTQEE